MTFGTDWGWGTDEAGSREIFKAFFEAGGNFHDTANHYTNGTSEEYLGKFINEFGSRDTDVIATKYSLFSKPNRLNDGGNHRKNLVQSVEGSLKRLGTDYIDLLYLHAWDYTTPEEEVMRGLDDLVRAGKVLYLGISDTPAWLVSRMQTLAEWRDYAPFIAYQLEYSLLERTAERDMLPAANHLGMSTLAWAPIAGGALTGKYLDASNQEPKRMQETSNRLSERNKAIAQKVVDLAHEMGCSPSQLAIAWVMNQGFNTIPIVGARTLKHLEDNLQATELDIPMEVENELDEISKIELGFPHEFLQRDGVIERLFGGYEDRLMMW